MAIIYRCFIAVLFFTVSGCKNISDFHLIPQLKGQTAIAHKTEEEIKFVKDSLYFEKKEEVATDKVIKKSIPRPSLRQIYTSQIGVRELTGRNDGPEIKMYLKSVGLGEGYFWCASFLRWSLDSAGIKTTINGMALSAENKKNMVYKKGWLKDPQPGDVAVFFYSNLGRIGHCSFWDSRHNDKMYISVEGNTGPGNSVDVVERNGNGIYRKYRSYNATHSISRWP